MIKKSIVWSCDSIRAVVFEEIADQFFSDHTNIFLISNKREVISSGFFKKSRNPNFIYIYDWVLTKHLSKKKDIRNPINKNIDLINQIIKADRRYSFKRGYSRRPIKNSKISFKTKLLINKQLNFLDRLIDKYKINVIVSFQNQNIYDYYITYCLEKNKDSNIINLRPARFGYWIFRANNYKDPPKNFFKNYKIINSFDIFQQEKLANYFLSNENINISYGGAKKADGKLPKVTRSYNRKFIIFYNFFKNIYLDIKNLITLNYRWDLNYDFYLNQILDLILIRRIRLFTLPKKNSLIFSNSKFFYFAMHHEPEVTLGVYNPNFDFHQTINSLALNLPNDYKIILKEHPMMLGKRWGIFYKNIEKKYHNKILFCHPSFSQKYLVEKSIGVISLGGSVTIDALNAGKPVMMIGNSIFNHLNCPAIISCSADNSKNLLKGFNHLINFKKIDLSIFYKKYVASLGIDSVELDIYSSLFKRRELYDMKPITERGTAIKRLGMFLSGYINKN